MTYLHLETKIYTHCNPYTNPYYFLNQDPTLETSCFHQSVSVPWKITTLISTVYRLYFSYPLHNSSEANLYSGVKIFIKQKIKYLHLFKYILLLNLTDIWELCVLDGWK